MTGPASALVLDSDAAAVAGLYPRLQVLCDAAGLDPASSFQLVAAIVEAVNNSIHHGYQDRAGHPIWLSWRCEDGAIEVEIRDKGTPLPADILEHRAMPMPDAESGRGWPIILEWTDSATYARIGDENVLKLRRRLDGPRDAPDSAPTRPLRP